MHFYNTILTSYPAIVHIILCIILVAVLIYGVLSGNLKKRNMEIALIISSLLLSVLPEYFFSPALRRGDNNISTICYHHVICKFYIFTMALFPVFLKRSGIVIRRKKYPSPFLAYLIFAWAFAILLDSATIISGGKYLHLGDIEFWAISACTLFIAGSFTKRCFKRLEYISHDFNKDILRALLISFFCVVLCSLINLFVIYGKITDLEAALSPVFLETVLLFSVRYFSKIGDASHLAIAYKNPDLEEDNNENVFLEDGVQKEVTVNFSEIVRRLINYFDIAKPFLNQKINVNSSSRELYTNRSYFSEAVNEVCHMNFSQFCNKYKLREAVRLFFENGGNKSITEYYQQAGFSSLSGFISAFNKNVGVSPGGWSKKMRVLIAMHVKVSIDEVIPFAEEKRLMNLSQKTKRLQL